MGTLCGFTNAVMSDCLSEYYLPTMVSHESVIKFSFIFKQSKLDFNSAFILFLKKSGQWYSGIVNQENKIERFWPKRKNKMSTKY